MGRFDFTDETDEEYKFGDKIDNADFRDSLEHTSLVSYRYIQLKNTDYHFSQPCLDNRDVVAYFKFMQLLTSYPFNRLREEREREWHLYPTEYKGNLKRLIKEALNLKKELRPECVPAFYHFALYTDKRQASRKEGIKSPRVYFFFGQDATIYPLFYDPYHEINPY